MNKIRSNTCEPLDKEEWEYGRRRRQYAFRMLYILFGCGLLLTLLAAVAWVQTVTIIRQFVASSSLDFLADANLSTYRRFLRLDISSMSAFIILLFALCLSIGSVKIIRQHNRMDGDKFSYVYWIRLFPRILGPISIRFGLIGTLISFLLIALLLFQSPPTTHATSEAAQVSGAPSVEDERVSADIQTEGQAEDSMPDKDRSNATFGQQAQKEEGFSPASSMHKASQSSFQVFLLLCASLYSTLVGCMFGYFVIPLLEWSAAWATGQKQVRLRDPKEIQETYESKMRLGLKGLEEQMEHIGMMVKTIEGWTEIVDGVTKRFRDLPTSIEQTIKGAQDFKKASQSLKEAADSFSKGRQDIEVARQELSNITKHVSKLQRSAEVILRERNRILKISKAATASVRKAMKDAADHQVSAGKFVASQIERAAENSASQLKAGFEELHSVLLSIKNDALEPVGRSTGLWTRLVEQAQKAIESLASHQEATQRTLECLKECSKEISECADKTGQLADELHSMNEQGGQDQQKAKEQFKELQSQLGNVLKEIKSVQTKMNAAAYPTAKGPYLTDIDVAGQADRQISIKEIPHQKKKSFLNIFRSKG